MIVKRWVAVFILQVLHWTSKRRTQVLVKITILQETTTKQKSFMSQTVFNEKKENSLVSRINHCVASKIYIVCSRSDRKN